MIKNTEKKYNIMNHKLAKRITLLAGISCTSLFLNIASTNQVTTSENKMAISTENKEIDPKDYYDKIYREIYLSLNQDDFDDTFNNLYQDGIIIIDEVEYPLEKLRVRHTKNGITHFVLSGNNFLDVYTHEKFNDSIDFVCPFRDSTMFYQMYQDGIITSDKINLSADIMEKYAEEWNVNTHTAIPRLKAETEANKIFKKTYKKGV